MQGRKATMSASFQAAGKFKSEEGAGCGRQVLEGDICRNAI